MLRLHRSERADALVGPLADVLADPPDDAFALDVVAVPTRGVERWLAQRLSHRLGVGADGEGGIAAAIRFDSPGRLLDDVANAALGTGHTGDDDPWSAGRLTWHLLDVVDACAGEPWCSPLGRHLGVDRHPDDVRRGRRMQAAAHLAALFTSYGTQRPTMVAAWARGSHDDGTGQPVPADLDWQVRLWQRLRDRLGAPSPAERLDEVVARLRDEPGAVDLPDRLSVFGATRLAEGRLRVLAALADHRDVHLWLPHPSPALWDAVGRAVPLPQVATRVGGAAAIRRTSAEPAAAHPLLASMARDVTELAAAVRRHRRGVRHPPPRPGAARHPPRRPAAPAARRRPGGGAARARRRRRQRPGARLPRPVASGRGAARGPHRAVRRRPDARAAGRHRAVPRHRGRRPAGRRHLRPRARRRRPARRPSGPRPARPARRPLPAPDEPPAVPPRPAARDGRRAGHGVGRRRPARAATRSAAGSGSATRTSTGSVRGRWRPVPGGARTAPAASGSASATSRQGTWETALDRILLGAAMAEEEQRYVGSAAAAGRRRQHRHRPRRPARRAGRPAVLRARRARRGPSGRGLAGHARPRARPARRHVARRTSGRRWRRARSSTRRAGRRVGRPGATADLRLPDVRALLARRLRGRPTRAGFRTGALTMCSMEPMRAVPHRVVVLLGMDDGAFPRGSGHGRRRRAAARPAGRRARPARRGPSAVPRRGHRGHRAPGRAVHRGGRADRGLAGRRRCRSASSSTRSTGPRSTADGTPLRDVVVVRHPLQTVDERNFTAGCARAPRTVQLRRASRTAAAAAGRRTADLAGTVPATHRSTRIPG